MTWWRKGKRNVLTLSEKWQDEFKDRLEAIITSSSDIGWAYHDMLCDDYYRAFPEDD